MTVRAIRPSGFDSGQKAGRRSGLALSTTVCAVSKPVAPGETAPRAHVNERAAFVIKAG